MHLPLLMHRLRPLICVFVASSVVALLAAGSAAGGTFTLGTTSVGPTDLAASDTTALGNIYTLGTAGTATRLSVYVTATFADQSFTPVVYVVSGGVPGALVTSGPPVTVTSGQGAGWVDAPLNPTKLSPGNYLVGLLFGGTSDGFRFAVTTTGDLHATTMSSDTAPDDPWPGSSIYDGTMSVYLTLSAPAKPKPGNTAPTTVCTPAPGGGCYESLSRAGYCAAAGNTDPGTGAPLVVGSFLNLFFGQPTWDPHYTGASPAIFVKGKGITCDPPPVGYVDSGRKVNSAEMSNPSDPGAIYEYWVPAG
jgi:hypothetical protein